ncbi:hypothetical protein EV702DRAFT_1233268 [Suillus placidus]|uniref:Uncharacterized protein n=1 Tax=Suillus placidus TaxID=48579 RepID=A0A9P7D1N2_9AGAM|nr:hypothetical protein EV702DRAFT_1233268 [Suillus placidus]
MPAIHPRALRRSERLKIQLYKLTTPPIAIKMQPQDLVGDTKLNMYAEDQAKFTQAVGNHLTYLKGKYKTHRARFKQTGAGVNLLAQVLADFPWYDDLDEIWRDNPAYAAKTFSSAPGTDHAGDLKALTQPTNKGKGKMPPPPNPDQCIEHPMVDVHDTPNAPDVEDEHDVDINADFTMGEELDYDGIEPQHTDTMQEDQVELEGEEALTIQRSLSNKRPLSSPSPPPTHTHNHPSLGTFKNHTDRAMSHGPIRSPKPASSIVSSSMKTTARTCSTSSALSSPTSSSRQLSTTLKDSGAKKSHLGKNIGSEVESVRGQVETLTSNMSYIYTAKAAASEYKIAKVNALCHERDLNFQHKKAEIERTEAVVVHQHCQESKTLDLHVLEAQAKVHAERKAALQLEIELIKLRGGVAD